MSGTSFNWSSNLYRPEKTLRKMSMSTAADMWAGSRSPMSSTIGKLSVWSAARVSEVPWLPPPHAATAIETAPKATAKERNLERRVIHPPLDTNCKEGAACLDVHRPLPGDRGESAPATELSHPAMAAATPRSIFRH